MGSIEGRGGPEGEGQVRTPLEAAKALIHATVVAVPTSVGYGASLGGVAALLGMLNSCAPGVTVVNIDNGYGAGVHAARVARQSAPR